MPWPRPPGEKKVLTQMGNQGYCGEAIRRVAEYVAAGAIGDVTRNAHHPGPQLRRHGRPAALEARSGRLALGRVDRPGALSRLP